MNTHRSLTRKNAEKTPAGATGIRTQDEMQQSVYAGNLPPYAAVWLMFETPSYSSKLIRNETT